ncbi:organic solute transporter Ostalpha-domain-containing protein [Irpex rosettiformis]|uniref:Organic solute transporter Ostalpha-domain-containing protein n=1 Tax=Irpex rosettiformis TaxID=378272 RepID=A0ACB8U8G8_9APHY|nr:organic solute transporter Ostalpha-domain-containing protein [Irpex rosettiformis]
MSDVEGGRCHNEKAPQDSPPLFQHGKLDIQMHHIGWLVSGVFTIAAAAVSFWLMHKHLRWYTNKKEQRYIIRILLMVPLYAIISTASFLFWNHSTPLLLVRDCYEAIVLTSFFYLLLLYISPDPEQQKDVFRKHGLSHFNDRLRLANGEPPRNWMFPFGRLKARPQDGLYFLQMMKWGVLQYCVVRPITTLAAVILDYVGLYCEDSWSPGWGHLYISVIVSISVSVSMYCLIQLYVCVSSFLAPQKPLLKMFAIKAVVFLTFWQATFLSLLATFGFIKDTQYMTAENINIGIGAIAETVEMTLFAILHVKAFSYKPYVIPSQCTNRLRALIHAFNFMETYRELRSGIIYMWHRMRGRETDVMARRQAVLESVFGKSRFEIQGGLPTVTPSDKRGKNVVEKDALTIEVAVEQTVHVGEERPWLGASDNYGYSHTQIPGEKILGLGKKADNGLNNHSYRHQSSSGKHSNTGYNLLNVPVESEGSKHAGITHQPERAWWRSVYNRLSQTEPAPELNPIVDRPVGPPSKRAQHLSTVDLSSEKYDDPPPPSSIRKYQESRTKPTPQAISSPTSQLPPTTRTPRPRLIISRLTSAVPIQSATSLPSVSSRPNSFLAGVFSPISDASNSTEALSGGATSSQSHRTQVQLTIGPSIVPSAQPKAIKRKPVRYSPPPAPFALPWNARIEELEEEPFIPERLYDDHPRGTSRPRHISQVDRSTEVKQGHGYPSPAPSPPRRHVPRRDQIVLPAPLAPPPPSLSTSPPGLPVRHSPTPPRPPQKDPRRESPSPSHRPPQPTSSPDQLGGGGHKRLRRSKHADLRAQNHTFTQPPPPLPTLAPDPRRLRRVGRRSIEPPQGLRTRSETQTGL